MFLPKGEVVHARGHDGRERECRWDETMFWNVYYVKGAFLDSDKAFEVLSGMRTAELRILAKCINTIVLARALSLHPLINAQCAALPGHENGPLCAANMTLGLPAPLFTIDFEGHGGASAGGGVSRALMKRFFDNLEPAFGLQVSLGQVNTQVLCPALTSHSEMSDAALHQAGISPTTVRISVGDENPRFLLDHLRRAAAVAAGSIHPAFAEGFPDSATVDKLYREIYIDVHTRWVEWRIAGSRRGS
jgi:cystathionine beta-lyase/cystathionine gamma-synthase